MSIYPKKLKNQWLYPSETGEKTTLKFLISPSQLSANSHRHSAVAPPKSPLTFLLKSCLSSHQPMSLLTTLFRPNVATEAHSPSQGHTPNRTHRFARSDTCQGAIGRSRQGHASIARLSDFDWAIFDMCQDRCCALISRIIRLKSVSMVTGEAVRPPARPPRGLLFRFIFLILF